MQLPISGLIYSDIGLGRCTSPEYLTFQRQPKIWSDFYENCAKTSLQLGQLEMLNIPGNAQMKMIEDHNTTKAIAMQENTHLGTSHICAPQEINIFVLLFHSVLTESSRVKDSTYQKLLLCYCCVSVLREDPFRLTPPTFGHCPNSDWTPPRTQPGTLGHFFSGHFLPFCRVVCFRKR